MKPCSEMGRIKAVPPIVLFIIMLLLLGMSIARATSIEMIIIRSLLTAIWLAMGLAALWIFVPQWDPWLKAIRKKFRGRKIVALTFDDGPSEPWTTQVLDILQREGIHATFFVVGEHAKLHADVIRRTHTEGHVIGGHTATHRILTFLNPAERLEEIETSIDTIENIIGCRPNFFRLPHGFKFPGMYTMLKKWNLIPIPWTRGLWDTAMPTADVLVQRCMKRLKPFEIVLLHDGIANSDKTAHREHVVAALPAIITEFRKRGYAFVTIADLGEATCEARRER